MLQGPRIALLRHSCVDRIATTHDLQRELHRLLQYAGSPRPSRVKLSHELDLLALRLAGRKKPEHEKLPKHELREDALGRFTSTPPCDACGKPTGADFYTDEEVCGGGDGPGFYLCGRKACIAKRSALDVSAREILYTAQRERNDIMRERQDLDRLKTMLSKVGINPSEAEQLKRDGVSGSYLAELVKHRQIALRPPITIEELRARLNNLSGSWRLPHWKL